MAFIMVEMNYLYFHHNIFERTFIANENFHCDKTDSQPKNASTHMYMCDPKIIQRETNYVKSVPNMAIGRV